MSIGIHGIGLRLLTVRKKLELTQAVVAAQLGVSSRTYIFYEQEKREAPASLLVAFCEVYDVDLLWLLTGQSADLSEAFWDNVEHSFRVVLEFNEREERRLPFEKLASLGRLVAIQSQAASQTPEQSTEQIFKVI